MRIGFDIRMISHPGIGRYIRNLLTSMAGLGSGHEFILFGNKPESEACNLMPKTIKIIQWNPPIYSLKERISNPFGRHGLDIIHIPHFNAPFSTGKGRGEEKLVVTIHDLIYAKFPEYLPFFKRRIADYLIKDALVRADNIIAVSENTREDILKILPESNSRIEVIYEASDPMFKLIEDRDYLERISKKYGISGDIILFAGSLKRHKNIETLLDSYERIRERVSCSLVITGRYHRDIPLVLQKIKASGAIYLGEVPAEDLVGLYNLARLLVLPSLYEGFGLPVLEAFACNTPVAASNISSLPEIAGGAALLFNPYDAGDICDKVCGILTDESLQKALIEKGAKRLKEFSWQKTAQETLAAYENVLRS